MVLIAAGGVPRPRLRRAEIAHLVRFGRVMVAFEAVGFANAKIDNLIVGWFAGRRARLLCQGVRDPSPGDESDQSANWQRRARDFEPGADDSTR
jgi:hypothetical protein